MASPFDDPWGFNPKPIGSVFNNTRDAEMQLRQMQLRQMQEALMKQAAFAPSPPLNIPRDPFTDPQPRSTALNNPSTGPLRSMATLDIFAAANGGYIIRHGEKVYIAADVAGIQDVLTRIIGAAALNESMPKNPVPAPVPAQAAPTSVFDRAITDAFR